jgi:patatin-like phospholipase/acyl hydrolase
MPGTVRILSFDGGGIRGLIPALVLGKVAAHCGIDPASFADRFHLVAGTSTGGILAAGLCAPAAARQTPEDLVRLYRDRGPVIFANPSANLLHGAKYDPQPLEAELAARLGQTQLSEARPELLLTAWDIERAMPRTFKSWRARRASSEDVYLRDAARATSAAPTYFPPAEVLTLDANISVEQRRAALVDGGLFANDPAAAALAEAERVFRKAERIVLLSFGTGRKASRASYAKAREWGVIGWAPSVIDILMDAAAALTEYQLGMRAAQDKLFYFRVQVDLDTAIAMDDTSSTALAAFAALADRAFQRFEASGAANGLKLELARDKPDPVRLGFAPDAPGPML